MMKTIFYDQVNTRAIIHIHFIGLIGYILVRRFRSVHELVGFGYGVNSKTDPITGIIGQIVRTHVSYLSMVARGDLVEMCGIEAKILRSPLNLVEISPNMVIDVISIESYMNLEQEKGDGNNKEWRHFGQVKFLGFSDKKHVT